MHGEASVGKAKVESALERLRGLNSGVRYVGYHVAFGAANAVGIVEGRGGGWDGPAGEKGEVGEEGEEMVVLVEGGYDIVLDCTDNPAARYLISDVCVALGRVLVSGAAQRGEGQLMRLNYPPEAATPMAATAAAAGVMSEKGPCYRCVFPNPPAPETVQSCSEIGILGPVVGVIGTLMAMEVLNIVTVGSAERMVGAEEEVVAWRPNLLLYNALSLDPRGMFRNVGLRRGARRDCLACGDEEVLRGLRRKKMTRGRIESGDVDYEGWCGRVEDLRILEAGSRVSAEEFVERMRREEEKEGTETERAVVVDVRETVEFELGAKVKGSVNIPISRILRHGWESGHSGGDGEKGGIKGLLEMITDGCGGESGPIYFVCRRGNDSQIAAEKLLNACPEIGSRWVGDVAGGFEALQKIERSQSEID